MALFWFFVLVGILIFAHEGGHFLFAKLFKVKVLTFSLGFGTPIRIGKFKLSIKPGETEYRIAWFPIGGFVKMLGEDPSQEIPPQDTQRAFSSQSAWKRATIIFGGPLFSVLLAVPIYFVFHLAQTKAAAPVIGMVVTDSPAGLKGLQPGDTIVEVAGEPVDIWDDIDDAVQASHGKPLDMVVRRAEQSLPVRISPEPELDETGLYLLGDRWDLGIRHRWQANLIGVVSAESPAGRAGLQSWDLLIRLGDTPVKNWMEIEKALNANGHKPLAATVLRSMPWANAVVVLQFPFAFNAVLQPEPAENAPESAYRTQAAYFGIEPIDLYIREVAKDFPADQNGIVPGDKIVEIFGQPVNSWEQFSRIMYLHQDQTIAMKIRHAGSLREISFMPKEISQTNEFKQTTKKRGFGVTYKDNTNSGVVIARPHLLAYALKMSVWKTAQDMYVNVMGFVRLFQGRVELTEALGGPIFMAKIAAFSAEKGWDYFIGMIAFVSVLLGLLNLLPIPILDGGHLMFILIEVIRRRPISIKTRVVVSYVGLILLATLMIFVFGLDINRFF